MEYNVCIMALIAIFCIVGEASPQSFQKLFFHPPPTSAPHSISPDVNASLTRTLKSGTDVRKNLAHGIVTPGDIDNNLGASKAQEGPVTTGRTLAYHNNEIDDSIIKKYIPSVRDSLTKSLNTNMLNKEPYTVDANILKSQKTLANGFQFECNNFGPFVICQWIWHPEQNSYFR